MDQNNNKKSFDKDHHFVGRQIRAQKVLCIDNNNVNHGVISISEALKLAKECDLDLVQINHVEYGVTPTCKIINYSKFKYEISKKQKLAARKQREAEVKIKEIKFRPSTDMNDLRIKAKHAESFLNEGFKVKISLHFKGREISHQNIAIETFNTFISLLPDAQILNKPSMEGKEMSVLIYKKDMDKTG